MANGLFAKMDSKYRIILPAAVRQELGADAGDYVLFELGNKTVTLRRARKTCAFCGSQDMLFLAKKLDVCICHNCLTALNDMSPVTD